MPKTEHVQSLEEKRPFLKLYYEEDITAVNIQRPLGFTPNSWVTRTRVGNFTKHELKLIDQEVKEIIQSVRVSSFLKSFTYNLSGSLYEGYMTFVKEHFYGTGTLQGTVQKITTEIQGIERTIQNEKQALQRQNIGPSQPQWQQKITPLEEVIAKKEYTISKLSIYNHLTTQSAQIISAALIHNPHLMHIDLKNAFLDDAAAKFLAKIFDKNKVLKYLDLSHNDVRQEGAEALAEGLRGNDSLEYFDISGNKHLPEKGTKALADALSTHSNLEYISLPGRLNPSDSGIDEEFSQMIQNNKHLSHLDISNNHLSIEIEKEDEAIQPTTSDAETSETPSSIQTSTGNIKPNEAPEKQEEETQTYHVYKNPVLSTLVKNSSITYLNLSNTSKHGDSGYSLLLAQVIEQNKTIVELDISSNQALISAANMQNIVPALAANETIRILHANSLALGELGGELIAAILVQNKVLTTLHARSNNLGFAGIKPVADALKSNSALKEMNVASNNLDEAGGLLVGKALEQNTTLIVLDISDNSIREVGLAYIAQALENNASLKDLNISAAPPPPGQSVQHLPQQEIVPLIPVLHRLESLDISYMQLDHPSATKLAAGLNGNKSLRKLILDGNGLGDAILGEIFTAIKDHPLLYFLSIRFTGLSANGMQTIAEHLKENLSITHLDLSTNNFSDQFRDGIKVLFENNFVISSVAVDGADFGKQLNFESALLNAVQNSSLIAVSGLSDSRNCLSMQDIISKRREKLFKDLKRLEREDEFELKELLILYKQLQANNIKTTQPELSVADMKDNEFYIQKIAEIFCKRFYEPRKQATDASSEEVMGAGNHEEAVVPDINEICYNALSSSDILGLAPEYAHIDLPG